VPEYLTPGVYFEFYDAEPPEIRRIRTDVAGFVGLAERGAMGEAVRIDSWRQFQAEYGNFVSYGYLAYAVKGFFENGGRTCFIVRVAGNTAASSSLMLVNSSGGSVIKVTARNVGTWGDSVAISFTKIDTAGLVFSLMVVHNNRDRETFQNLSLNPADDYYFARMINEGDDRRAPSRWIEVEDLIAATTRDSSNMPDPSKSGLKNRTGFLSGGQDGLSSLLKTDFTAGLDLLGSVDAVGIVAIPDIHIQPVTTAAVPPQSPAPPSDPCRPHKKILSSIAAPIGVAEQPPSFSDGEIFYVQRAMVEHCEYYKDRIAVLEVPIDADVLDWRSQFDSPRGFAALYHPWIKVLDPLELNRQPLRTIPPSGHIAGVYAEADFTVGVHRAPANIELEWAEDITEEIGEELQGVLNPEGVNCLRPFPGRGIRVYGARTVSSDPDWCYVNVRRLLMMIEEAVDEATQWAVFEPNDYNLRQKIILSVTSFLETLRTDGALAGATSEEAFFVKCDDTNNPPSIRDLGRLIVDVGVAPTIPAEFVIFRIGRTAEELEIVER
jgi:uncharacterized protein